jgi:hypothetical protein
MADGAVLVDRKGQPSEELFLRIKIELGFEVHF